jgi:flavodoxin
VLFRSPNLAGDSSRANEPANNPSSNTGANDVLIAYFSHTGNTEMVAEHIQAITGGDLFEITTVNPYPEDYDACIAQARQERADDYRPELATQIHNIEDYDFIFLGYPIWGGHTPMAIRSFLEEYTHALVGKTIIPFSTSNTTGISQSVEAIRGLAPYSNFMNGLNITGSNLDNAYTLLEDWIVSLDTILAHAPSASSASVNQASSSTTTENSPSGGSASSAPPPAQPAPMPVTNTLYLHIGNEVLTATLSENTSTEALKELLASGNVTINMRDYGGFEKVGSLGTNLPTNDVRITSEPGDLILYQGNQLVIFYAPNSWSYTRLGKINDVTQNELINILGSGNVTVTLSLTR